MNDVEFDDHPELSRKRVRYFLARDLATFLLLAVVLISLGFIVIDSLNGNETRRVLLDCTQPEGKCAQENAKATGAILQKIFQDGIDREHVTREVVVAAIACSQQFEGQKEITKCVEETLGIEVSE